LLADVACLIASGRKADVRPSSTAMLKNMKAHRPLMAGALDIARQRDLADLRFAAV
jgi:hypothetical protein